MTHIKQYLAPRYFFPMASLSAVTAALGWMPNAIAQNTLPVTGGDISFSEAQVYVPNAGNSTTAIFEGATPDSFLIQTSQGDIPMNAVFQTQLLPELSTGDGAAPVVGDTGSVKGSLSFLGFTADGLQAIYNNIPTDLEFQVSEANFTQIGPYDHYRTEAFVLDRFGSIVTAASQTDVSTSNSAVGVQYLPEGSPPENQMLLGQEVDASLYQFTDSGTAYEGGLSASLTGGEVLIPANIGVSNGDGTLGATTASGTIVPGASLTLVGFTSTFILPTSSVTFGTPVGGGQDIPVMPTGEGNNNPFLPPVPDTTIGVFVFVLVPSGLWFDPPTAEAFAFEMQPAPQPIGLRSRVFPGLSGRQEETSLFTQISGLPEGIDADDRFTVTVGDVVLGEFTAQETVDFRQYRDQLGDLLVDGQGVERFVVSGIEPGVDPDNPRAFPIKLDFNTPTASFEMKARGVELARNQQPVARLMKQPVTRQSSHD